MPSRGFDRIAWLYDPLAKLIFGDQLLKVQLFYLDHLDSASRVLILGGGTGELVEHLLRQHPGCQVTFVDASREMTRLAQRRLSRSVKVRFIHGTELAIPENELYDVVITPFYLDMFPEALLDKVIQRINEHLTPSSLWLAADFCHSANRWHRFLLAVMYLFFRLTTGISANSLPDWNRVLETKGWTRWKSFHLKGFIEGALYRRT